MNELDCLGRKKKIYLVLVSPLHTQTDLIWIGKDIPNTFSRRMNHYIAFKHHQTLLRKDLNLNYSHEHTIERSTLVPAERNGVY